MNEFTTCQYQRNRPRVHRSVCEQCESNETCNPKPPVICLCGSTRFADHHAIMRWEMEKLGAIVLMINYLPEWYAKEQGWDGNDHFGEQAGIKKHLDDLHFRKIDLSDKIFVINVDGYIGDSTRREIEYALATGKPVEYLEDPSEGGH